LWEGPFLADGVVKSFSAAATDNWDLYSKVVAVIGDGCLQDLSSEPQLPKAELLPSRRTGAAR